LSPPRRGTKPRPNSADARGGNAIRMRSPVVREFQVKIGIRHMVIPGARIERIVVTMCAPPRMVPKPWRPRPNTQRSPPIPGEYVAFDNGAYANQPHDAAPWGLRNRKITRL